MKKVILIAVMMLGIVAAHSQVFDPITGLYSTPVQDSMMLIQQAELDSINTAATIQKAFVMADSVVSLDSLHYHPIAVADAKGNYYMTLNGMCLRVTRISIDAFNRYLKSSHLDLLQGKHPQLYHQENRNVTVEVKPEAVR
jgi:hypothetical protein